MVDGTRRASDIAEQFVVTVHTGPRPFLTRDLLAQRIRRRDPAREAQAIDQRVPITIGCQVFGWISGASATYGIDRISYDAYLRQLRGNTTESATDVSALGSLPATSPIGNGQVILPETLAANLGLGTQNPATQVAVVLSAGQLARREARAARVLEFEDTAAACAAGDLGVDCRCRRERRRESKRRSEPPSRQAAALAWRA